MSAWLDAMLRKTAPVPGCDCWACREAWREGQKKVDAVLARAVPSPSGKEHGESSEERLGTDAMGTVMGPGGVPHDV